MTISLNLPRESAALWRSILTFGHVKLPEWEANKLDVKTLVEKKLVIAKPGVFPAYTVELVDPHMRLTVDQVKVMTLVSKYGTNLDEFLAEAKLLNVEDALRDLQQLVDLDTVEDYSIPTEKFRYRLR